MWIGLTLYPRNPYAIQTEQKKDIHKHVTDWTKASQKPKCHGINNSTRFTVTIAICAASQTEGELLIGNTSGFFFFFIFLANYHLSLYFCLPYNIITMIREIHYTFNRPQQKDWAILQAVWDETDMQIFCCIISDLARTGNRKQLGTGILASLEFTKGKGFLVTGKTKELPLLGTLESLMF